MVLASIMLLHLHILSLLLANHVIKKYQFYQKAKNNIEKIDIFDIFEIYRKFDIFIFLIISRIYFYIYNMCFIHIKYGKYIKINL